MSDPVSWFLIEPGWKVLDPAGDEIGQVEEVVADTEKDIFNGLKIATGLLSVSAFRRIERQALELEQLHSAVTLAQAELDRRLR